MLLRIPLTEASVKISNGEVNDDKEDLDLPVWAGYMPYRTVVGPLQAAKELPEVIAQPDYRSAYGGRWSEE